MSYLGGRDSRPSLSASETAMSSSGSNALNRPRIGSSAPTFNPYDKFTENDFADWIGSIKGTLRGALGLQEEQARTIESPAETVSQGLPNEEMPAEEEYYDDHSEEELEEPIQLVTKGKERDPREGPGLVLNGAGTFDSPIDLGLDSDPEDEAQDEEESEGTYESDVDLPEGAGSWIRTQDTEHEDVYRAYAGDGHESYADEEHGSDIDEEDEYYSDEHREVPVQVSKPEIIELLSSSEDEEEDGSPVQHASATLRPHQDYISDEEDEEGEKSEEDAVYGHLTDDEGSDQDDNEEGEVCTNDAKQASQNKTASPSLPILAHAPSASPPLINLFNAELNSELFAQDSYTNGKHLQDNSLSMEIDYFNLENAHAEEVAQTSILASVDDRPLPEQEELVGPHDATINEEGGARIDIEDSRVYDLGLEHDEEEIDTDHLLQYPDSETGDQYLQHTAQSSSPIGPGSPRYNYPLDRTPSPAIGPRLAGMFDLAAAPSTQHDESSSIYNDSHWTDPVKEIPVFPVKESPVLSQLPQEPEMITVYDSEEDASGSEDLDDSAKNAPQTFEIVEEDEDADASGESDKEYGIFSGPKYIDFGLTVKQEAIDHVLEKEEPEAFSLGTHASLLPGPDIEQDTLDQPLEQPIAEPFSQGHNLEVKHGGLGEDVLAPEHNTLAPDLDLKQEATEQEPERNLLTEEQSPDHEVLHVSLVHGVPLPTSPSLPAINAEWDTRPLEGVSTKSPVSDVHASNFQLEEPLKPATTASEMPKIPSEYILLDEETDEDASGDDDDEHMEDTPYQQMMLSKEAEDEGYGDEWYDRPTGDVEQSMEDAQESSNEAIEMTIIQPELFTKASSVNEIPVASSTLEGNLADTSIGDHRDEVVEVSSSPSGPDETVTLEIDISSNRAVENAPQDRDFEIADSILSPLEPKERMDDVQEVELVAEADSIRQEDDPDTESPNHQRSVSPQASAEHEVELHSDTQEDSEARQHSPAVIPGPSEKKLSPPMSPLPSDHEPELDTASDKEGLSKPDASHKDSRVPASSPFPAHKDEHGQSTLCFTPTTFSPSHSPVQAEQEREEQSADCEVEIEEPATNSADSLKPTNTVVGHAWVPEGDHYVLEETLEEVDSPTSHDLHLDDGHHHVHFLINQGDDKQIVVSPGESSEERLANDIEIEEIPSPPSVTQDSFVGRDPTQTPHEDQVEASIGTADNVASDSESEDTRQPRADTDHYDTDSVSSPTDDIFGDGDDGDEDTAPSPPMEESLKHSPFQTEEPLLFDAPTHTTFGSRLFDGDVDKSGAVGDGADALEQDDSMEFEEFLKTYIQVDDDEEPAADASKNSSSSSSSPLEAQSDQSLVGHSHAHTRTSASPNAQIPESSTLTTYIEASSNNDHDGPTLHTPSIRNMEGRVASPQSESMARKSTKGGKIEEVARESTEEFESSAETPKGKHGHKPQSSVSDSMESLFGGKSSEEEESDDDQRQAAKAVPLEQKISPLKPVPSLTQRSTNAQRHKRSAGPIRPSASISPSSPAPRRGATAKRKATDESRGPRKKTRKEAETTVRQSSVASSSSTKSLLKRAVGSDGRPSPDIPDDGSFIVVSRSNNTPQREHSIPVTKSMKGKEKAVATPDKSHGSAKRSSKQESNSSSFFSFAFPSFASLNLSFPSGPLFHTHGTKQEQPPPPKQASTSNLTLRIPARSSSMSQPGKSPITPVKSSRSMPKIQAGPSSVGGARREQGIQDAGPNRQHSHSSHQHLPSRSTRSNCRFHKISIPKDEGAPRAVFLVPGCSLTDFKFMKDEEIEDMGDATMEDASRMVQDVETLDFLPYLKKILRMLVGPNNWREKEVYYLPGHNELPVGRIKKPPRQSTTKGRWEWADDAVGLVRSGSPSNASVRTPASKTPSAPNRNPSHSGSVSGTPLASTMLRRNVARRQSLADTSEEEEDGEDGSSDSGQERPENPSRPKLETQQSNRPLEGVPPDHQALLTQPLRGEKSKKRRYQSSGLHDDNYIPASSDDDASDALVQDDESSPRKRPRIKKSIKRWRASDAGLSSRSPKKLKMSATSP